MASRDPRLDAEADSPNWLAEVIAGLAAREFKRINDPDAHAHDRRDPTWFASSDTATVRVVAAGDLRTVLPPNLRSPDCRTADDKLRAELVRLVDALQALTLRVEMLEGAIAAGRAGVTA